MKNILLFLSLVFIGTGLFAQSLSLSWDEGSIPDGSEITFLEEPQVAEIESHIFVTNESNASVNVMVTLEETSVIPETLNYFCWGACYPPGTGTSTTAVPIGAGETNNSDFSGHYQPDGLQGTSKITYTFYVMEDPDDKVSVVVNYISGFLGLNDLIEESISLSNAYPNPANYETSISYNIEQFTDARIIIHNLLGSEVRNLELNDSEGIAKINVSDLREGVYFYSLMIDEKLFETRKLMIKR